MPKVALQKDIGGSTNTGSLSVGMAATALAALLTASSVWLLAKSCSSQSWLPAMQDNSPLHCLRQLQLSCRSSAAWSIPGNRQIFHRLSDRMPSTCSACQHPQHAYLAMARISRVHDWNILSILTQRHPSCILQAVRFPGR